MLNYRNTIFTQTDSSPVAQGELINEEGAALVILREGDKAVIKQSTGAADEIFAGFSYERTRRPTILAAIHEATLAAVDGKVMVRLERTPEPGKLAVWVGGSAITVEVGADVPTDTSTVNLDGSDLIFHLDAAGEDVRVQFLYEPTVSEARTHGDGTEFNQTPASADVGVCGRIVGGTISTNYFDIEADWADETKLHPSLGADGRLTIGGSGTELTNLIIKEAPNSESAFLTVEFIR